jgi:hypothetical protein
MRNPYNADKITVKRGLPSPAEGAEGDLSLNISKYGIGLYGKVNSRWYRFGMAQEFSKQNPNNTYLKQDLSIKDLDTNDITSSSIFNSGTLTIDKDITQTTSGTFKGLFVDMDQTENAASGQIQNLNGIEIDINTDAATHVGTVFLRAYEGTVVGGTSGVQEAEGMKLTVSGSDTDRGLVLQVEDGGEDLLIRSSANLLDNFMIEVGAEGITTLSTRDFNTTVAHMTLNPDGDLILDPASTKVIINATDGLYLDGGGDTYIHESAANTVRHIAGGDIIMQLTEKGDDGNEVKFGACVGFEQIEPTYDATTTLVDFRFSNKQFVTFGSGNITNLSMTFPLVSGNFVLLVKQDGTGSRTITNYKVYEFDESTADGYSAVKFAGGSNPTLTTDANHVDILSFYWDAGHEIAYGVATLDFQF